MFTCHVRPVLEVTATGVLNISENPGQAAKEIHRVLKPGGSLLVSVAAAVPRFVDEERWRYLPLGLNTVFAQFLTPNITPEARSVGGFCRLANLGVHHVLKLPILQFAHGIKLCLVINLFGTLLKGIADIE